ncbi:anti-sigma factor [Streptomyces pluripotens]|uniref:Regulator of SigK n=1 Tax=Streptomyces pluripotens TaxID=1355015 RepID=A0A221NW15_9ACTN|nr:MULTISPECIES: anti-sigma factor [Streptomyces]ARP69475.1 anti-sigma factor [Streptomyces pluripotens]ASN23735.1 anti-sigma factor [Streptomyces pluripotens]KIE27035.1 anti-sigma-K factor RskA [Streptomyces sp. MUSC 125]MCH0555439.1 anti-sigma factor [Streptomyces sp. MUM 16J]
MSTLGRLLRREAPHSLAAPYALDALEPGERCRFEKHLQGCDRCAAEVRALAEDAVRLAWQAAAPAPTALRDRVLAAVRTIPQEQAPARERTRRLPPHVWGVQPPPGRTRTRRMRSLFVPLATATAAAALVVASLFAVQANRTQDRLDAERARSREIAHVLAAPDTRAARSEDAHGRSIGVVASESEREVVVTLSGYGTPADGRVHQLWLMRPGAQPRSLGLFAGDTPLVATGLDPSSTSLAVTVEPDGGSAQPTGRPIVQLTLKSVGFGE